MSIVAGDGGDQVMNINGLSVHGPLLVGVGGELDGDYSASLLGDNGPQVAIVIFNGKGKKGLVGAGIEIGHENGIVVKVERGGGTVAIGGDFEQELCGVRRAGHVDGLAVDASAQLDVLEMCVLGELLGFGKGVVQVLHGDADN